MPNPHPSNPKKIKKGEVRNPLGAGAHNKEVKAIRRLTHDDIAQIGSLILEGNLEKLKQVRADPATNVLKVWICSVAIAAINKGDAQSLNALLDRIVGKPKEDNKVHLTLASGVPTMTVEEAAQLIKNAQSKC